MFYSLKTRIRVLELQPTMLTPERDEWVTSFACHNKSGPMCPRTYTVQQKWSGGTIFVYQIWSPRTVLDVQYWSQVNKTVRTRTPDDVPGPILSRKKGPTIIISTCTS